jgi:hypothetical protein
MSLGGRKKSGDSAEIVATLNKLNRNDTSRLSLPRIFETDDSVYQHQAGTGDFNF